MQHNNLKDKGVVEVASFATALTPNYKKDGNFGTKEPMSVLDTRSPSPSTSSSTHSSCFGGTNGEKSANLLVGSDKSDQNRDVSASFGSFAAVSASGGGDNSPEQEFAAELQAIPAGLELNRRGSERYNFGLEDLEGFLSESLSQDQQPLLRWVSGDCAPDSAFGLKQLLLGGNPSQVEGNADFVSEFENLPSGVSAGAGTGTGLTKSTYSPGTLGSEYCLYSNDVKLCPFPNSMGLSNMTANPHKQNFSSSPSIPQGFAYQPQLQYELKSENLQPQGFILNQVQPYHNRKSSPLSHTSLLCDAHPEQPQPKRHNRGLLDNSVPQVQGGPFLEPRNELLHKKAQNALQLQQIHAALGSQLKLLPPTPEIMPLLMPKREVVDDIGNFDVATLNWQQQQEVVYDQIYKAIDSILAGNFSHAQGILARLNHQFFPFTPVVKPFHRSALCFKEALQLSLMPNAAISQTLKVPSPFDSIFKMGAYKMFSEVSPLVQFKNFTSNQALLEALGNEKGIHIIDFDIGIGAQWTSFMQELPRRNKGLISLKITAFASPSTHHPFEISLMHESLSQCATEAGISFQLEVVNFDTFEPSPYAASSFRSSQNEAIAISFPIWSSSARPSLIPSLLCFIKQLSPKAVVLLDRGCDRYDLPPPHHLLHALQYHEVLLESIDAANMAADSANKIEKLLFQPKIESIVCGRLHSPNIMPPFANLLVSAGFTSIPISSFSEAQAEWVLKRAQVRGFHAERRNASLVLFWQRKELLSASVWKC